MATKPLSPQAIAAAHQAVKEHGGIAQAARAMGISRTTLQHRVQYHVPSIDFEPAEYPHRVGMEIETGVVLVFSDAHFWPGPQSTANRALLKFAKDFGKELKAVVCNGDALDAATVSRHPPIGWESRPSLALEIESCQERMGEIEKAAGKARKVWNLGNHDSRFETRIASVLPELARVKGVHLTDHFPIWEPAWATWINDNTVIKHRFKNGIHAPHNNTLWGGRSIVTGHLHSAKVMPITDYNGTRFGVDTGCLAHVDAKQFVDYTEDNARSWRSAFAVLTYHKGRLLWPELAVVSSEINGEIDFRGKVINV